MLLFKQFFRKDNENPKGTTLKEHTSVITILMSSELGKLMEALVGLIFTRHHYIHVVYKVGYYVSLGFKSVQGLAIHHSGMEDLRISDFAATSIFCCSI